MLHPKHFFIGQRDLGPGRNFDFFVRQGCQVEFL